MKPTTEAREKLGRAIRDAVKQSGLSYAEIGRMAQIHPSQVSRICRGDFRTMSANLMQICSILGVIPSARARSAPQVRLEQSIVALWDQTPQDADRLVRLIRQIAELRDNDRTP